ncbi:Phosphate-selective porin O and P [Pedobacter westerhofensis]|uniref:Phosphate-selective porin O and P n=1 Tax=Pedobacter westerhofensis TaxID=425512 RepID=A0A521DCE6_9SPHI|nr:porin [Pedobacter westerhofensis]SMO69268.1 Phosphate-selective porin O and P [Pedobacter westerhofensis]
MKKAYFLLILFIPAISFSQSNNAPSSYDPHDIKITGYLQTQFQQAQSSGISSFSGGDFAENSDNRFIIRRGRLKIDRVDKYSSIVFQIDATQNGINLMDAFIQLQQPDHNELRLTAGLFNRPFGYSIVYSSGYRDFPERARVFQTIMPRERDIGAMLSYQPLKFLTADLAVVNGSGLYARDYDSKKDIIGSLTFKFDSLANRKLQLGFGASFYKGSVRNDTESFYTSDGSGFIKNTSPLNAGANLKRNYFGGNIQIQYNSRHWGATTLKAEFVSGTQPGVAASPSITGPVASQSFTTQPATDLYLRNFTGYYLLFTQQVAKTKFNALVGYDVYDPNNKVKESQIGVAANTSAGDIKFSTLGYGLTYLVNPRVKLTAYNERVINAPAQLDNYRNDIRDDVFTLRLQYRW